MPLHDLFHPPLSQIRNWEGFHTQWPGCIAAQLNTGLLPARHFAEPQVTRGRVEVDVATDRLPVNGVSQASASPASGGVATMTAPVWAPPAPSLEMDAVFTDEFTVLVISTEAGPTLVGPSNWSARRTRPGPRPGERSR